MCTYFLSNYRSDSKTILRFASDYGLSGASFSSNKILTKNGEKLEDGFFDPDNVSEFASIKSYAIIPLHGSHNKVIGILQLYNKKTGVIGRNDIKMFKQLQKTLGRILKYVLELSNTLDYLLVGRIIITKLMKCIGTQNPDGKLVGFV